MTYTPHQLADYLLALRRRELVGSAMSLPEDDIPTTVTLLSLSGDARFAPYIDILLARHAERIDDVPSIVGTWDEAFREAYIIRRAKSHGPRMIARIVSARKAQYIRAGLLWMSQFKLAECAHQRVLQIA